MLWFDGVRYGDIQIHVKKFCMVWCSAVYPELPQLTHSLRQYLAHSIMWIYFFLCQKLYWQIRETSSSFALCNICSSQRHRNWFSSSNRHAMSLAPLRPGHFPPRSLSPLWWWVKGWWLKGNKHELIASQPTYDLHTQSISVRATSWLSWCLSIPLYGYWRFVNISIDFFVSRRITTCCRSWDCNHTITHA